MSKSETPNKDEQRKISEMPLGKKNYQLLAISFLVVVAGFTLMIGGGSDDPAVFNPAIYGFRRITLAPVIVLFGFLFGIYAIMKRPS